MIIDYSRVGLRQWISLFFSAVAIVGACLIFWTGAFLSFPLKYGMDLYGGVRVTFAVTDHDAAININTGLAAEIKRLFHKKRIAARVRTAEDGVYIKFLGTTDSNPLANNFGWIIESIGDEYRVRYPDALINEKRDALLESVLSAVRARIETSGYESASVYLKGKNSIEVEKPGIANPTELREQIGRTGKLIFEMLDANGNVLSSIEGVKSATPDLSEIRDPKILVQMTHEGGIAMKAGTKGHTGKRMRVRMEGEVDEVSHADLASELGETFAIHGIKDLDEVLSISRMISAGALPVALHVTEENVVGPTLGQAYIKTGITATFIAMMAVWIIMLVAYGWIGLVANIALLINVALLLIFMTLTGSVLTLPGILGIALTAGTAVDANVLINENLRRLSQEGKSWRMALEEGYARALQTIMNSNATTLIAAAITYCCGSGPIRGFAITWSVGLIISFVTAVVFTKAFLEVVENEGFSQGTFGRNFSGSNLGFTPNNPISNVSITTRHPICRIRSFGTALSLCGIACIAFAGLVKPLNWGVDFTGGVNMEIECDLTKEEIQDKAGSLLVSVQECGENRFLLKSENQENTESIRTALSDHIQVNHKTYMVGPKLGQGLLWSFGFSILIGLICMWIYIAMVFGLPYAHTAIGGLVHDIIFIFGIYAVFGIEFDEFALVGMLSTIGYSINDTIVIFDAIKEKVTTELTYPTLSTADLVWQGVVTTLRRTLLTSITTAAALLVLCVIDYPQCIFLHLAAPLLAGVIVGTYSSIFLVAPYLSLMHLTVDSTREDV